MAGPKGDNLSSHQVLQTWPFHRIHVSPERPPAHLGPLWNLHGNGCPSVSFSLSVWEL